MIRVLEFVSLINYVSYFRKLLEPYWKDFQDEKSYQWLKMMKGISSRPQKIIHPKHSIIIEVKAAEIVSSGEFGIPYTLRFPRFVRIRQDKPILDAMTLNEMYDMKNGCQIIGQISKEEFKSGKAQSRSIKKLKISSSRHTLNEKTIGNAPHQRSADLSNVVGQKCIFTDLEIIVSSALYHNLDECGGIFHKPKIQEERKAILKRKEEYEKLIASHGGICIVGQMPQVVSSKSFCIIADHINNAQIRSIIKMNCTNVISPKWLEQCFNQKRRLIFSPSYVLFATDEMKNLLRKFYDDFGDSYCDPIEKKEDLLEVFYSFLFFTR